MENVSQLDLRVLSTAMDATANGIVITDLHGVIEWANPAFSLMTGYARHELLGQHTHILKSNEHDRAFYQGLWQTILAGQTWFGAMINRRKDGTLYDEEMSITPVRDATGQLSHFIAIKQDVTARKLAEAQLQAANEELTLRLAEISALHEQLRDMALRDPLTNLFNRRYLHEALLREVSLGATQCCEALLPAVFQADRKGCLPPHQSNTISTQACTVKSELSRSLASSAGFKGATLREASRASRASRSARRSGSVAETPFEINCL